ncbi:cytochrome P450 [Dentipellis sp. KUC8613]|nr:cytochrome P450 [Dentipellis sp. KUC8613]
MFLSPGPPMPQDIYTQYCAESSALLHFVRVHPGNTDIIALFFTPTAMVALTLLDAGLIVVFLALVRRLLKPRGSAPLPPGPKGYPVIGNLLDMPQSKEWLVFASWAEKYGDMVYVTMLSQPLLILNSLPLATALLEKKSLIYSDRPVFQMAGELVGMKHGVTFEHPQNGTRFRDARRMMYRLMGTKAAMERFWPLMELETSRFLRRVRAKPDDVQAHIRQTAGAIILKISHGYEIKEKDDPFVELVNKVLDEFSQMLRPGAFFVDILPILKYVPEWFPGTGWKQTAKAWAEDLNRSVDEPHEFVKQEMAKGTAMPSFTSTLMEEDDLTPQKEFDIKWAASTIMGGGADTTVSAIYSFFLAMTLHPEAQRKSQAEIDAVIGNDRLPSIQDRENLPYVNAVLKEVMRWNPVAPLGAPHRVIEDDVHDGYFIPKGTIVMANSWKFLHDEQTYKDPMKFVPERFMGKNPELDPYTATFGYGRRICPGILLADTSLFISFVMSLSVFNIEKAVENGKIIEPEVVYLEGAISHPKPFKCSIKPRSEKAEVLIDAVRLAGEE